VFNHCLGGLACNPAPSPAWLTGTKTPLSVAVGVPSSLSPLGGEPYTGGFLQFLPTPSSGGSNRLVLQAYARFAERGVAADQIDSAMRTAVAHAEMDDVDRPRLLAPSDIGNDLFSDESVGHAVDSFHLGIIVVAVDLPAGVFRGTPLDLALCIQAPQLAPQFANTLGFFGGAHAAPTGGGKIALDLGVWSVRSPEHCGWNNTSGLDGNRDSMSTVT
jgi:hypothetical protein